MKPYTKPKYEMADVFNKYGQDYRNSRKLPLSHHKVINAIENCRTAALGGHTDKCSKCDYTKNTYNSCRNRHCPKCQGMDQLKWIDKREAEVLPVGHFHVVFTIPKELNNLCLMNKKELYGILFKASSESVTMLCADKKYLGAKPGIISVLHTWGQNLMEHPHIHMIVTAGGLSNEHNNWVKSRKKFFLPVRVLSKVFRGKFLAMLKEEYKHNNLTLLGSNLALKKEKNFKALLNILYEKSWVVYSKKPFGNAPKLIKYLGKYTHRIAISNHRITAIDDQKVSFRWKDYADKSKKKVMSLDANEFIRRFLLHSLPKGFCKIRYYGIIANKNKKNNLLLVNKILKNTSENLQKNTETWQEQLLRLTGFDVLKCPICKKGQMLKIKVFENSFSSG